MNKKLNIEHFQSLPVDIEELMEQLKTEDCIHEFASKLVRESDKHWAG